MSNYQVNVNGNNYQVQVEAVENTTASGKVTVKGGIYRGARRILRLPVKTIETAVDFTDDAVILSQRKAFFVFTNKNIPETTKIPYSSIHFVQSKKRYGTANIVWCVIFGLLALFTLQFLLLLLIPVILWAGRNIEVSIIYSSAYQIPIDFVSEADELENKINTAIAQSKGEKM